MKTINKIILFFLAMPAIGKAQVLGPVQGNNIEISSVVGVTANAFMNKLWLYRNENGNDWSSARLHDGISVDASFLTPQTDTRCWWERDPYKNIQSWGNGASTYLTINGGNVGIGTSNASSLLELGSATPIITLTPASYNGLYKTTLGTRANAQGFLVLGNNGQNEIRAGNSAGGGYLDFFTNNMVGQETESNGNHVMRMTASGNVGIGTTTPREKLSVNGKIRAQEIKVEIANWPDYVFAKDYPLPSLAETEKHIKEKGHLQGIPSAEEVKNNGIDLGDMNSKLLKKIEELTLHLIEENKRNNNQEKENSQMRQEINQLLRETKELKDRIK